MGRAPLSRLSNGFDVATFKSREPGGESELGRGRRQKKSHSVFSSSISAGRVSVEESKRRLRRAGGRGGGVVGRERWLVIHQDIKEEGCGAGVQLCLSWLMEPTLVSGVDRPVNKAMHSVVRRGRNQGPTIDGVWRH